ncbi:unnamed protein product [Allacma fusca]|uniref:Peptidase M12B propeptide domain-containing protein n=1 Tax=Allacma fusca TaxID=39272 RepID=A0A8J2L577_9HEXA|nr:unnamed protein product [Allacma fusca]
MHWKLVVVGSLILIFIFTIIVVSVLSSVQPNYVQLHKIQSTGLSDTGSKSKDPKKHSPNDPPAVLGQTRDFTIPYKLPPTPQDEELWFDEIMKFNRLKPPSPSTNFTNNNSNFNQTSSGSSSRDSGSSSNNKHYNHQRIHIDSGNFRVQLATIWDPHPSYRFHAFSKDWRIDLVPSTNFIVPGFRVTEHGEGGNESSRFASDYSGCFYTGVVNGDEKSSVAVSLCHGMTGHIRTSDGSYFIEPTGEWKGPHIPIQHVIYKLPSNPNAHHDDVLQPREFFPFAHTIPYTETDSYIKVTAANDMSIFSCLYMYMHNYS